MKAFSIQQPWGSLICAGIKDVENRKWAAKRLPMQVLIHTGAKRQPFTDETMPYPYYWHIENYQRMGILPPIETMPTSAIIGVATIDRCEVGNKSLWAMRGPGAEYQWVIKDAKMFKEPILNVKGKLGFFDIPQITEDNLPECIDVKLPHRDGDTLYLPLNATLFNQIKDGENEIYWNIVDENLLLFADDALKPLKTRKVVVSNKRESIEIPVSRYEVYPCKGDDGKIMSYKDELGRLYDQWEVRILLGD